MLEKLKEFHKEEGHYHVPSAYPDDPTLSKWCTKQKAALRNDDLSWERKQALEEIGFPGPKPKGVRPYVIGGRKPKRKRAQEDDDGAADNGDAKKPAVANDEDKKPAASNEESK